MKIDLTPLLSAQTAKLPFTLEDFLEGECPDASVTLAAPANVSGVITNQAGYLHITLQAKVTYEAVCARCLAKILQDCSLELSKGVKRQNGNEENEDDNYLVYEDHMLALDGAIWDLLFLELPYRHLCREDCAGICPECGKNRNEGDCGCTKKTIDPRLAILGTLLEETNE